MYLNRMGSIKKRIKIPIFSKKKCIFQLSRFICYEQKQNRVFFLLKGYSYNSIMMLYRVSKKSRDGYFLRKGIVKEGQGHLRSNFQRGIQR